jgi:hypothetical protein
MDPVLDERRARHAERRVAAARQAAALERIADLEPRIAQLGTDELEELAQLAVVGHGDYAPAAHALRSQVRTRREELAAAAAITPDASDDAATDEQAVGAPTDGEPGAEDPAVDVDEQVDGTAAAADDDANGEQQSA